MDWNFILPLLGGAVGAAIVNSAFSFYKLRRDADLEHEQWRRDQRQIGYTEFLVAGDNYVSAMNQTRVGILTGPESKKALADARQAFRHTKRRILLVSPPEVVECSMRVSTATSDMLRALREQLPAKEDAEREARWDALVEPFSRAISEFTLLARLDLGILEKDSRTKIRTALTEALDRDRFDA